MLPLQTPTTHLSGRAGRLRARTRRSCAAAAAATACSAPAPTMAARPAAALHAWRTRESPWKLAKLGTTCGEIAKQINILRVFCGSLLSLLVQRPSPLSESMLLFLKQNSTSHLQHFGRNFIRFSPCLFSIHRGCCSLIGVCKGVPVSAARRGGWAVVDQQQSRHGAAAACCKCSCALSYRCAAPRNENSPA